jgi:serine/threonine-protein kinase
MLCPSCRARNDDAADMCFNCGRGLSGVTRGSVIADRYEILEQLGRGGMGLVYKAHDRQLDEMVVLKLLRSDLARAEGMAKRFRSEIKLARRVRHPNVCAIHEFGQDGDFCFITMELVEGVDLKREIRATGALPAGDAFHISVQLAAGLQAIHDGGIVHRDLKTANIMRDRHGRVRLMDFGIAKQVHSDSTGVTLTGQVIGTPEYMSPEQALGTPVDYRSDVYALGIVVFEIFTGRVPFQGETPIATLRKQVNDPPPLHGPEGARLPPRLLPVLARALAKDPDDRFASAAEMGEALEQARVETQSVPQTVIVPSPYRGGAAAAARAPAPLPETAVTPVPSRIRTAVGTAVPASTTAAVAHRRPGARAAAGIGAVLVGAAAAAALLFSRQTEPTVPLPAPTAAPPTTLAEATIGTLAAGTPAPSAPPATSPPALHARARVSPGAPPPTTLRPAPPRPSAPPARAASPPVAVTPPTPTPAAVVPTPAPAPTPAPGPAPGRLQVLVRPWAEVSVDGRVVGTTPFRPVELPAGEHVIAFRHPDYKPFQRRVTVAAGQTTRVEIDLAWEAFPR